VSYASAPQKDDSQNKPVEPVKGNGVPQSSAATLTTLPEKRPSRRFFGLLPGRRSA
jgi:hypothetical protein